MTDCQTHSAPDLTPQQETMRRRGICVVIPAYNNVGTAAVVAREALEQCADVYVVCDGCTDGTRESVEAVEGVRVISYGRNRGKGHALKCGFRQARRDGFSYAITLDADGQHPPRHIADFLEANRKHPGAIIVGNRRRLDEAERSRASSFANRFADFWFAVQTCRRGVDTQSGYRLYPLRKLPPLWMVSNRYESELAMLVLPSWRGVKIRTIDVDVHYPPASERVSHFRPGPDFARISVLNTLLTAGALAVGAPLFALRWLTRYARTLYAIAFTLVFAMGIFTPAVTLWFAFGKTTERKRMRLHRFLRWAARFVMIRHGLPGVRFSYAEAATDWADTPKVVICNHQSHFDLLCQLIFTPRIVFLTNKWVWNNPIYGAMIRRAEYCLVTDGIDALMPRLRDLAARGYSIAVYPEGSRSADCSIRRFHQGAFHIARELGLEVVPMCLYGPGRVLPKGKHVLYPGPIHIEAGRPISRAEFEAMGSTREQARELHRRYVDWYARLSDEIEREL